jgi:hypothetical protein
MIKVQNNTIETYSQSPQADEIQKALEISNQQLESTYKVYDGEMWVDNMNLIIENNRLKFLYEKVLREVKIALEEIN